MVAPLYCLLIFVAEVKTEPAIYDLRLDRVTYWSNLSSSSLLLYFILELYNTLSFLNNRLGSLKSVPI